MSDDLSIPRNPVYRATHGRSPDRMTHRLMLIAGGLAGALVLIVVLWSSVGRHGGPTPVVQADQQPVRIKPTNPGGMQIPGLSADTGSADGTASADKLAPAPETPDPAGLAKQTRAAAVTAPSAGGSTPPVATSATGAAARQTTAVAPVTAKPTQLVATAVPPRGAAVPALEHRTAAIPPHGLPGRTQVQLAAVTSEAAARQEWDRLSHRMPAVLGAHHPMITKVEHDGHTLWRVRTGEFPTEAEANQFCHEVRAKGAGCAVATF